MTRAATPREQVQSLLDKGLKLVFWPDERDWKGPRASNWLDDAINTPRTIDDYVEGHRVGIIHGDEISPGRFVVDVDLDWAEGVEIAKAMLPLTKFLWGRPSKRISHCLYTCPDTDGMFAYKDIGKDGATLIEFRSDVHQSMAPPSTWERNGKREPLAFVIDTEITYIESAAFLKRRVCLAAIGMLISRHAGRNGFGHEMRLAWAGVLLRAGISVNDLEVMGKAISKYCNNTEVDDVRRVLESTEKNLVVDGKKVKGGPALAKLLGAHGKEVVSRINEWLGLNKISSATKRASSFETAKRTSGALCRCSTSRSRTTNSPSACSFKKMAAVRIISKTVPLRNCGCASIASVTSVRHCHSLKSSSIVWRARTRFIRCATISTR